MNDKQKLSTHEDVSVGEGTVKITVSEAKEICKRLEFDASWDKCGSGYYTLKTKSKDG